VNVDNSCNAVAALSAILGAPQVWIGSDYTDQFYAIVSDAKGASGYNEADKKKIFA